MSVLRIVLADRSEIWRRGLRRLLNQQPDLLVVADVADGSTACAEVADLHPDVTIVALTLPALDALHTTATITRLFPSVAVVILSDTQGPGFREAAFAVGAAAYTTKQAGPLELVRIIREIATQAARRGRGHPRPDSPGIVGSVPDQDRVPSESRAALARRALNCDWPRRERIP
jgi:DNA-binding NarL/FixJ family response regulator